VTRGEKHPEVKDLMGITGKYGIFQYSDLMDFNRIYWTLV
jgi:hypothetical protein